MTLLDWFFLVMLLLGVLLYAICFMLSLDGFVDLLVAAYIQRVDRFLGELSPSEYWNVVVLPMLWGLAGALLGVSLPAVFKKSSEVPGAQYGSWPAVSVVIGALLLFVLGAYLRVVLNRPANLSVAGIVSLLKSHELSGDAGQMRAMKRLAVERLEETESRLHKRELRYRRRRRWALILLTPAIAMFFVSQWFGFGFNRVPIVLFIGILLMLLIPLITWTLDPRARRKGLAIEQRERDRWREVIRSVGGKPSHGRIRPRMAIRQIHGRSRGGNKDKMPAVSSLKD